MKDATVEVFMPAKQVIQDILIVDDNLENLRMLSALLGKQGYEVRCVKTGTAALMGAEAQPPSLILLDINMPEMNGYEVCRKLKANSKTRHTPVIFISALDEVFNKIDAFAVGGVDYITKPFQVEEVFARIENQLALQRLQSELQQRNDCLQKAEAELKRALDQERLLNEKIAEMTILEERNRIARDIHDSLGHALVALNIQLETALALWVTDRDQSYTLLQEAKGLGSQALESVRTSVTDIRTDTLQSELLEQALHQLIQEFQRVTHIYPDVALDLSLPLPNSVSVVIYRVVQEGLTNICKHADSTAVRLTIQTTTSHVQLYLEDNGKGFCSHHNQPGFGLQGMRERITALGGEFNIQSKPGQGCQVRAYLPRLSF